MNILGINAYHGDSAAALLINGELIAAAEEERFCRIKHWAGLPSASAAYCLSEGGLSLADVDVIAINQDSSANALKKIAFALKQRPDFGLVIDKIRTRMKRQGIDELLAESLGQNGFSGVVLPVEHHRAHLASAFFVSAFDEAAVVSVDGFGDFTSTAWGAGRGSEISIDGRVGFPHSLGIFYQALTQYLGFPRYGDEYKVMGLAPYGKPTRVETLRDLVRLTESGFELNLPYFRHHSENLSFQWQDGAPAFDRIFSPALEDLLGPVRGVDEPLGDHHHDIAHSIQVVYEEALFHVLDLAHAAMASTNLALAGGCAMNSVANGKIGQRSPFTATYIPAAAGDAGGAVGAAFEVWHRQGNPRGAPVNHAYWGPGFDKRTVRALIETEHDALRDCDVKEVNEEDALLELVSKAIAGGQVVGWFQGRMEWGPRALGHRSILCDPRRADMKAILNSKIKRRESFRPFAPAILRESVADWFEEADDVPFMMKVFQVREEKRPLIPAVTHVDGSGRLQTVTEQDNGIYYRLIRKFEAETGVPVLLNTSFNENEPVVCQPEEALQCFLRTRMDVLVMENQVILRRQDAVT